MTSFNDAARPTGNEPRTRPTTPAQRLKDERARLADEATAQRAHQRQLREQAYARLFGTVPPEQAA